MDKDQIYLEEIREFCQKIIHYTANVSFKDFSAEEKLQSAVIKLIENVGEASKRLSETARQQFPAVEWGKALAMRNRLAHDYMDVDLEIVYDVATNEIPALLKHLQ